MNVNCSYINPRPSATTTAGAVVDVDWAAAWLKIDTAAFVMSNGETYGGAGDYAYLTILIDAAIEHAESALDASLITRTIVATFDRERLPPTFWPWPLETQPALNLPRGPVQSVTSAVDANGNNVTFRLTRSGNADLFIPTMTYEMPLVVTYVAGYGSDPTTVPSDIRQAILMHVGALWSNREAISPDNMLPVPLGLTAFYQRKRRSVSVA